MSHPRLVFVDDSSNPGGAELSVSRYLQQTGDVASSVLLLSDGDVSSWGLPADTRVVRVTPRSTSLGQLSMAREIDRHLRTLQPDCVVCNSHSAAKLLALVPKRGRPFLQFLRREAVNPNAPAWKRRVREKLILRHFDGFLANSEWTARSIPKGLRASRPVEISYPISGIHAETGATDREPTGTLRLLSLSRWAPWKGIDIVLDAAAELKAAGLGDRIRVTVAGAPTPGEDDYARTVCAKAEALDGIVDLVGHVEDIDRLLDDHDVLLCVSVEPEPFGQVIVQGMAHGLHVIATDRGGPREIITDGVDGQLVPPRDAPSVATAVRRLLDAPAEADEMRERATAAAHRFADPVTVPMFTEAVESVSERRGPGSLREITRRSRVRRTGDEPHRVLYYRVHDPNYPRNRLIRGDLEASGDFEVESVPRGGSGGARFLAKELRNLWRGSRGVDAIIVSEFGLRYAPIARVVAWLRGCALVVDGFVRLHETRVEDTKNVRAGSPAARRLWWEDWLAIRLSDLYLVDTDARATVVRREFVPDSAVQTVPVGAPVWATPTARPAHDRARILYYGNYIPLHGMDLVVTALSEVHRQAPVDITFIGDGRCRPDIERLAAEKKVPITFVDAVPEEELPNRIADADIVLGIFGESPKARSVIANKVWQGLACGRVVITQGSDGIRELTPLVDDRQLVLTEPGSASSIAHELIRVVTELPDHGEWSATAGRLEDYVHSRLADFRAELSATIEGRT